MRKAGGNKKEKKCNNQPNRASSTIHTPGRRRNSTARGSRRERRSTGWTKGLTTRTILGRGAPHNLLSLFSWRRRWRTLGLVLSYPHDKYVMMDPDLGGEGKEDAGKTHAQEKYNDGKERSAAGSLVSFFLKKEMETSPPLLPFLVSWTWLDWIGALVKTTNKRNDNK